MQAEFQVLKEDGQAAFLKAACTLAETLFQRLSPGDKIVICCPDKMLTELDELLWSFNPESFLPHGIDNDSFPIILSSQTKENAQFVINLTPETISGENIYEIVGLDEDHKAACREKYKSYKTSGVNVQMLKD